MLVTYVELEGQTAWNAVKKNALGFDDRERNVCGAGGTNSMECYKKERSWV